MPFNIPAYLMAKNGNVPVGAEPFDIPAYLMAKAASGGIQEITATLPLTVRSRASQILKNYIIYGTASGAGVRTENLWDGEFEQGTLVTGSGATSPSPYRIRSADFFHLDSGTYTFSASGVISALVFVYDATTEQNYQNEGSPYWIGLPLTFTVTSNRKIKIVCRISDSDVVYPSDITNIMLTKGSTYIPYGYQIPLKVTAGGTTTDYQIYIGDSKLGEEEYVDYESGKVYKRTENDFPFAEKGTFAFGNDANIISDGKGKFVVSMPSGIKNGVYSAKIPLNRPYTIPQSVDTGGEFVFYLGNNVAQDKMILVLYDADGVPIEVWRCHPKWRSTSYSQMTGKTIAYIGLGINGGAIYGNIELTPMFSKSTNLTEYIPYLQPSDPPVPLPDITIPKGEVTIDTQEEFKYHASIKGRINPVHYAYRINPDTAEITYLADNKNFTPAAMGSTTFDYGS